MSVQIPMFEKLAGTGSKVAASVQEFVGQGFDVGKFVENFEVMVDTAGGMSRMRDLILDLARRGCLVDQRPEEGSGIDLAREFAAEAPAALVRGPQPPTWGLLRLGDVAEVQAGFAFPSTGFNEEGRGMPLIRIRDLASTKTSIYFDGPYREEFAVQRGDHLIGMDGEFKIREWGGKSALLNQRVCRIIYKRGALERRYVLHLIQRELDRIHLGTSFTTVKHLSNQQVGEIWLPLPPLAEQKRIVAKVDQLMALCDELDARQTKKRDVGTRLTKSALEGLTNAEGREEFDAAWKRVVENFDALIDRAQNVAFLRSVVLGLGLNGSLTRLSRKGENSEGLPLGWSRTTLGDLASFVTSGSRNWKNYYAKSGATFIRSQDIKTDALDLSTPAFVAVPDDAEGTRTRVTKDDILITITGANVGKAARVDRDVPEAYVSQHVALVRLKQPELASWVQRWLISTSNGRGQLLGSSYGDKPGLNLSQVKSVLVDLPPPPERDRILQLMADMLALCDRLASRLREAEDRASELVEAVVQEFVGEVAP